MVGGGVMECKEWSVKVEIFEEIFRLQGRFFLESFGFWRFGGVPILNVV